MFGWLRRKAPAPESAAREHASERAAEPGAGSGIWQRPVGPGAGPPPFTSTARRARADPTAAMTRDLAVTLAALKQARAAEDEAEVTRLMGAFRVRAAVRHASPRSAEAPGDPLDRMDQFERIAGLLRGLAAKRAALDRVTAGARSQPGPPLGPRQRIELLERLAALRDRGVLTAGEFAAEKARILGA